VRLGRAAPTTELIELREEPVEADERVVVIGFPGGLPAKVDASARVVDSHPDRGDSFTLRSDTFAVSSGSRVFDRSGARVGVFARGRRDYDSDGSCQRVHREPEYDAPGYEEATQIAVVVRLLAAAEGGQGLESLDLFPGSATCTMSGTDVGVGSNDARTSAERATGAPTGRDHGCAVRSTGTGKGWARWR